MITDQQCLDAIQAADKFTDENGPDHDFECMKKALKAAFQWQPIADAPKDGTTVVLIEAGTPHMVLASWCHKNGEKAAWRRHHDGFIIPKALITHFFPLPLIGEK